MDEVKGFGDRGDDEVVLLQGEEGRRVSERGDATTKEERGRRERMEMLGERKQTLSVAGTAKASPSTWSVGLVSDSSWMTKYWGSCSLRAAILDGSRVRVAEKRSFWHWRKGRCERSQPAFVEPQGKRGEDARKLTCETCSCSPSNATASSLFPAPRTSRGPPTSAVFHDDVRVLARTT